MKNYDQSVEKNHKPNWHYVLDHAYRILIIGGSASIKNNGLLNLMKHERRDIVYKYLLTEKRKQR